MKTKKTVKLNANEHRIVALCAKAGRATLAEMTKLFVPQARKAPRRWSYVAEVATDSRNHWRANLLARNGIRRPVREGLIRKVKPGTYAITALGARSL